MPGLARPVVQDLPGLPVGEPDRRLARAARRPGPAGRPLAALDAHKAGALAAQGVRWRSLPEGDFDLAVDERDGFLVYTWNLRTGRTVPAGTWVFAGQYHHESGGRDAGGDPYTVRAGTGSGQRSVGGGLTARDDKGTADEDGS